MNQPEWDVVVVGTGMGGSAAGAICAMHGLKTLILEKNPRPGGSCSYYEKNGFHMDTGTHLFNRGNLGPFGTCTKRLGLGTPIDFVQTKETARFRGMNIDITLPRNQVKLAAVLPLLAWQLRIPPTQLPNCIRLFKDIFFMKEHELEAYDGVSIDDFLFKYTDHDYLRSMLAFLMGLFFILPTWEASAGESIWNLQKFMREAALCYPKGGAVAIPKTFLRGAEFHGANVRMNAGVKKIEVGDGRVKAAILENGDRITTRSVISTSSLKDTVFQFAGAEHFPEPFVEKVRNIKSSMIAVQAKIAVKKKLVTAGALVGGTPLTLDRSANVDLMEKSYRGLQEGRLDDFTPIYAPIPTNFDPSLAPEGCQIITACTAAPTLDIELKDPPEVWINSMMDALYTMIPDLKENILFCDTWSVQNVAAWIGKSTGAAVTTGQTTDQVGAKRPGHRTPVTGLYMAGDSGGPARGIGTELACRSGMDCADLVAHDKANYLI